MQIPSSISSSLYSSPSVNRQNSQTPVNGRQESQRQEPKPAAPAQADVNRDDSATVVREPNFAPVEPAQEVESSRPELSVRQSGLNSSKGAGVTSYQQIANGGANDAKVQDPSLFRVDVYV